MKLSELAILAWGLVSLAAYVGLCVWAWRKAEGVTLDRQDEDERSQKRRY